MQIRSFTYLNEYAVELIVENHSLEKSLKIEGSIISSRLKWIKEIIPQPNAIVIIFDPISYNEVELINSFKQTEPHNIETVRKATLHTLPLCTDYANKEDVLEIERATQLNFKQFIDRFLKIDFVVEMFGFMPGFFYMGGLPKGLRIKRKASPSLSIPSGSVAIAHKYCGIYPTNSPGGWYVVGKTTRIDFESQQVLPIVGDKVRFQLVSSLTPLVNE